MRRLLKMIVALMLMAGGMSAIPATAGEIATGTKVPLSFKAIDAVGHTRNWSSIAGKKGTVLVLSVPPNGAPIARRSSRA